MELNMKRFIKPIFISVACSTIIFIVVLVNTGIKKILQIALFSLLTPPVGYLLIIFFIRVYNRYQYDEKCAKRVDAITKILFYASLTITVLSGLVILIF